MKPNVLLYKKLSDQFLNHLSQYCQVSYFPQGRITDNQAAFDAALAKAEGIIGTSGVPKMLVDDAFLDKAPLLRVASTISVGYDNYDVDAMTARKVLLTHTPDVLTETTADTMFALLMATARRIPELDHWVKSGQWKNAIGSNLFGIDIHHKTLGIIGMGRIGQAIAQRGFAGFGMKILYHNRRRIPDVETSLQASYCELDELLSQSDFICIMLPLNEQTRNLINAAKFALMKPQAIVINGGRGPIINEQDLIDALKNNTIRAAGLDVYDEEPLPVDSELLTLTNLVTLPHIGSATQQTRDAMTACAIDNLIQALNGTIIKNCVNAQVLERQ